MTELLITASLILIKLILIFAVVLGMAAYMVLAERKILGRMQLRYGPNRVGPWGLLQPVADVIIVIDRGLVVGVGPVDVPALLLPLAQGDAALLPGLEVIQPEQVAQRGHQLSGVGPLLQLVS